MKLHYLPVAIVFSKEDHQRSAIADSLQVPAYRPNRPFSCQMLETKYNRITEKVKSVGKSLFAKYPIFSYLRGGIHRSRVMAHQEHDHPPHPDFDLHPPHPDVDIHLPHPDSRLDPHHAHYHGPLIAGCFVCKSNVNLSSCSRCKVVMYCSKEHQAQDWLAHKVTCNRLRHAQRTLDHEIECFHVATTDHLFREAIQRVQKILASMKTVRALEQSLATCMSELCSPCPTLSAVILSRILLVRLGSYDECYKLYKEATVINKGHDIMCVNARVDVFEHKHVCFGYEDSLAGLVPLFLMKLQLLLDVKALRNFDMLQLKIPDTIHDEIRYYLVSVTIRQRKDIFHSQNYGRLLNQLGIQLEELYTRIDTKNKYFWPSLLNPGNNLITPVIGCYGAGSFKEMQNTLIDTYAAWVETPGSIKAIVDRRDRGPGSWD